MRYWLPDAKVGENSLELQPIWSRGQMHSEAKSNQLFGADHVSTNDCQLLETKYNLFHFRVLIHLSSTKLFFFKGKLKNNKEQYNGLTVLKVEIHL